MRRGSTVSYQDVHAWVKVDKAIQNRVAIINEIHGCRYDSSPGNPCALRWRKGRYVVTYCGEEIASYLLYDMPSVDGAFAKVDVLSNALWHARRLGYASLSPVSRVPVC